MMKEIIYTKWNWFIILFLSFFISEAIYKFLIDQNLYQFRVAGGLKFIAQIGMITVILKNHKTNNLIIKLLGLLCMFFVIGQFSLPQSHQSFMHIEYLNNSIFIFITLLFFNNLKLTSGQKNKALDVYEAVVIINSIAIIIGFVFSISYLKTYNGIRFGYDGFLIKSSYASYFYLMAMFYFAHKCIILKKINTLVLVTIVTAAVITGTKANLLGLALLIPYIIIRKKLFIKTKFWIVFILTIIPLIVFYQQIANYLMVTSNVFEDIINNNGLTTVLFSFRNEILTDQLIPFISKNWTVSNFLFGGLGDIMIKSGLDFIDLVYYFGVVGALLYLLIFKRIIKTYKFNFNFDFLYFISIIAVVAALGGNFFYNSSVAIIFVALMFYFEMNTHES